jgi:uncharacterized membrane protein YfcA
LFDPILTAVLLVVVGLGAGTLGAMLGVGGGIIMVPVLTFLGISPTQTASTSLFAVTSTSVSSTVEFARQKRIDYRLGTMMAAVAVPGAVIGAVLSADFTSESFRLYFGILLVLAGLYMLYRSSIMKARDEKAPLHGSWRYAAVGGASFIAGVISSLFGVGGGIIFVPAMLVILGIGMYRAAATSQLILMITSVAGVLTHVALGHPDYFYAIALSAGAFVGAQIGARMSKSTKEAILNKMLSIALMAIGGKMILDWMLSR